MLCHVKTTTQAKRDLDAILARLLLKEAGEAGLLWFQGLREAVASLAHSSERCAFAPEKRRVSLRGASIALWTRAARVSHSLHCRW